MSREIGRVKQRQEGAIVHAAHFVHVSVAGVELLSDERSTLDPCDARTFAGLLMRAADEAERVRDRAVTMPQVRALDTAWNALLNDLRVRGVLVDGQAPPDPLVDVHDAVRALVGLSDEAKGGKS